MKYLTVSLIAGFSMLAGLTALSRADDNDPRLKPLLQQQKRISVQLEHIDYCYDNVPWKMRTLTTLERRQTASTVAHELEEDATRFKDALATAKTQLKKAASILDSLTYTGKCQSIYALDEVIKSLADPDFSASLRRYIEAIRYNPGDFKRLRDRLATECNKDWSDKNVYIFIEAYAKLRAAAEYIKGGYDEIPKIISCMRALGTDQPERLALAQIECRQQEIALRARPEVDRLREDAESLKKQLAASRSNGVTPADPTMKPID